MAMLEKYPHNELPSSCDYANSLLWIKLTDEDGCTRIEVAERDPDNCQNIHESFWGPDVWGNDERGYYYRDEGVVSCHGTFAAYPELIDRVAKKFDDAMYYFR